MMNSCTKTIQILFVIETNSYVRSDNAYIVWLLKKSFSNYIVPEKANELFIQYDFVYMDGKRNYSKRNVKTDIKNKTALFRPLGNTYVVYCIDADTVGKDEKQLVSEIVSYTKENKCFLILSYREIEDVVKAPSGGTKHERVKRFLNAYPKIDTVNEECLCVAFDQIIGNIGRTNFNSVIREIIAKEFKKKSN